MNNSSMDFIARGMKKEEARAVNGFPMPNDKILTTNKNETGSAIRTTIVVLIVPVQK